MKDPKKMPFTQILVEIKVEVKVVKPHLEVHMVDIINMKINLMEVAKETLEEGEIMETMVEFIEVNNQIMTQTTITTKNLNTWQITIIKLEHETWNGKLQQGNYASTNDQDDESLQWHQQKDGLYIK